MATSQPQQHADVVCGVLCDTQHMECLSVLTSFYFPSPRRLCSTLFNSLMDQSQLRCSVSLICQTRRLSVVHPKTPPVSRPREVSRLQGQGKCFHEKFVPSPRDQHGSVQFTNTADPSMGA